MIELERVHDPVRLSVLRSVLAEAEIESYVLDFGGMLPGLRMNARLMVSEDDIEMARHVIEQAGLATP